SDTRARHALPTRRSSDLGGGDEHRLVEELLDPVRDLLGERRAGEQEVRLVQQDVTGEDGCGAADRRGGIAVGAVRGGACAEFPRDRKSTRLNSSHVKISY